MAIYFANTKQKLASGDDIIFLCNKKLSLSGMPNKHINHRANICHLANISSIKCDTKLFFNSNN